MGKMAAISVDGGETADIAIALARYTELFEFLMYFGVAFGVFMLVISPLLKRGMHGVH